MSVRTKLLLLLATDALLAQPERLGLPVFVLCHSASLRVPLWAAYEITPERLNGRAQRPRHFRRGPPPTWLGAAKRSAIPSSSRTPFHQSPHSTREMARARECRAQACRRGGLRPGLHCTGFLFGRRPHRSHHAAVPWQIFQGSRRRPRTSPTRLRRDSSQGPESRRATRPLFLLRLPNWKAALDSTPSPPCRERSRPNSSPPPRLFLHSSEQQSSAGMYRTFSIRKPFRCEGAPEAAVVSPAIGL